MSVVSVVVRALRPATRSLPAVGTELVRLALLDPSRPTVAADPARQLLGHGSNVTTSSADPTVCPSCGRATRTTESGACVECWQAKVEGGRAVIRRGPARTEPLVGFNLDALDLLPGWVWWGLALGAVSLIALAVRVLVA